MSITSHGDRLTAENAECALSRARNIIIYVYNSYDIIGSARFSSADKTNGASLKTFLISIRYYSNSLRRRNTSCA